MSHPAVDALTDRGAPTTASHRRGDGVETASTQLGWTTSGGSLADPAPAGFIPGSATESSTASSSVGSSVCALPRRRAGLFAPIVRGR
jgi:hypothetical protein